MIDSRRSGRSGGRPRFVFAINLLNEYSGKNDQLSTGVKKRLAATTLRCSFALANS
jgi:hypothetical protein